MIYCVLFLSYLLGSIPFGLIFSKLFLNLDVRSIGSGNIGATNVLRAGNKKIAAATLFCDALKGTCAVLLPQFLNFDDTLICLCGFIAFLGHIFPIWLKFKGGKGVATALGVLLPLSGPLFLSVILLWLFVAKVFRISSLSALVAFSVSPLFAYLFINQADVIILCSLIFIILVFTHKDNIQRLFRGDEKAF